MEEHVGEEDSERRTDEGSATALCISDPRLGWFAGVRGVTPASHSVVEGLLPWHPQKNLISKYYP